MDTLTIELPATPDDWSGVVGRDLGAKLRELDVAARRIEAAIVAAVGHADRTGHYHDDGHRSAASWCRQLSTVVVVRPRHGRVSRN